MDAARLDPTRSDQLTVLGPDAKFRGELIIEGAGRILGTFEGTIRAGELQIGAGANCHATIEAGTIIIDGKHEGDLVARECLQLCSKANVQGDVTASALAVAEGATFVGRCVVGPDALATAARLTAEPKTTLRRPATRPGDWLEPTPAASTPAPDWLGQPAPTVTVRPWVSHTPTAEPFAA